MSISNKYNCKTFTKSPAASLLLCIKNILNYLSGKCLDSLTVAGLSFTKVNWPLIVQYLCTSVSSATAQLFISSKKMIPIPL